MPPTYYTFECACCLDPYESAGNGGACMTTGVFTPPPCRRCGKQAERWIAGHGWLCPGHAFEIDCRRDR